MTYAGVADQLVERIDALVPEHPEILSMDDPWKLFAVPGFKCDDLQPSMAQAGWALAQVKQRRGDA